MPQRILALEMPGNVVRAAVAERTWNSLHLTGVFEEQRASGEADLAAALDRLIARAGIPDVVISALPGELVVKRLLELPFKDRRRLNQVVPFVLEEHLPFPIDGAVVAFTRVGSEDDHTLVMAALARKPDLKRHLELLAKAGLDPKTVTLSTLALAALLTRSPETRTSAHLILDIGLSSASLVLVDSDGTPRALRTVNAGAAAGGGERLPAASHAGPILGAARQTLLAHPAGGGALDVVLTGSGAGAPALREEIAAALSLAVRDAGEFDYSFLLNGLRPDMSRFAGCVAMLLGELPTGAAEMLNFRQGEFAFRGRTRGDLALFYTTAILAGAAALLAAAHVSLAIGSELSRLRVLDREVAVIAAPALGPSAGADAMAALRSGVAAMDRRLALLGAGAGTLSPLEALVRISHDLPKRFPIEMQDVAIDGAGVKLSGQTDSFATIDQVKQALGRDGYFGPIEVTHAKAASNGKVDFQLTAPFADAAAAGG